MVLGKENVVYIVKFLNQHKVSVAAAGQRHEDLLLHAAAAAMVLLLPCGWGARPVGLGLAAAAMVHRVPLDADVDGDRALQLAEVLG